jgi:hypothetical protein
MRRINISKCVLQVPARRSSSYAKAKRGNFSQVEAKLTNQYNEDACLKQYLKSTIPTEVKLSPSPESVKKKFSFLNLPLNTSI